MSQPSITPGQIIAGKYRVDRVIGQGGMGVVVAATHLHLEERVAIKMLLPEMARGEIVTRFIHEAKAAVRIRSEHVARVIDVGSLENDSPYMVMEYLEGRDLAGELEARGPLPVEEAATYLLQACEALAEAHAKGIVHRDLKPANLFLTRRADGSACVKVLDFGISKLMTPEAASVTKTGGMLGSPLYMSPEQLTNAKSVDARTDVWSLGVILYELLTGSPPFLGEDLPQICVAILQAEIPAIRRLRSDVPHALELAVHQALSRDRNARLQNMAAFAAELAPFAPRQGATSVERSFALATGNGAPRPAIVAAHASSSPSPMPSAAVPAQTFAPLGATQAPRGGIPRRVALAAGLLVVLTGVAGIALLRARPGPAVTPPAAAGHAEATQQSATAQTPPSVLAPPPDASAP
jgi:serine/threonine-protein kinase